MTETKTEPLYPSDAEPQVQWQLQADRVSDGVGDDSGTMEELREKPLEFMLTLEELDMIYSQLPKPRSEKEVNRLKESLDQAENPRKLCISDQAFQKYKFPELVDALIKIERFYPWVVCNGVVQVAGVLSYNPDMVTVIYNLYDVKSKHESQALASDHDDTRHFGEVALQKTLAVLKGANSGEAERISDKLQHISELLEEAMSGEDGVRFQRNACIQGELLLDTLKSYMIPGQESVAWELAVPILKKASPLLHEVWDMENNLRHAANRYGSPGGDMPAKVATWMERKAQSIKALDGLVIELKEALGQ